MKTRFLFIFLGAILASSCLLAQSGESQQKLSSFTMQASVLAAEDGSVISSTAYRPPVYWFPVQVPTTVLSGLVANKVYPNPYEGMNNMFIPDASDEFNKQYQLEKYSHLPGHGNPWKKPYWFRTIFKVPATADKQYQLILKGINYRAEVWLNGNRIADSTQLVGMFAEYDLPVTDYITAGVNALAKKSIRLTIPGCRLVSNSRSSMTFMRTVAPPETLGKMLPCFVQ